MIEIFTEHRSLLFGIAYLMLGQVAEAEDAVQETWLRWQGQTLCAIRSPKAWLVSAVTRLCIDRLRLARHQREQYYGVWLPEPLLEPVASQANPPEALADSLTMTFMLMLEALSSVERAVFLLRNVFDYDYAEIAEALHESEANCRQIFSRAKARIVRSKPSPLQPTPQAERILQQFLVAQQTGSVDDLLALLTEDATRYADGGGLVPSLGKPIHGSDPISRFFVGIRRLVPANLELSLVSINNRPGILAIIDD